MKLTTFAAVLAATVIGSVATVACTSPADLSASSSKDSTDKGDDATSASTDGASLRGQLTNKQSRCPWSAAAVTSAHVGRVRYFARPEQPRSLAATQHP